MTHFKIDRGQTNNFIELKSNFENFKTTKLISCYLYFIFKCMIINIIIIFKYNLSPLTLHPVSATNIIKTLTFHIET